jgi:predicted DNA-binding WGR domain protein
MDQSTTCPVDLELRLIDPARNRFRRYGLTECRTLFGESCLRIQWGRVGHRRLRERCELFPSDLALRQRCEELLALRASHGYLMVTTNNTARSLASTSVAARQQATTAPEQPSPSYPAMASTRAVQREIVEAHGLSLREPAVQQLVGRWRDATTDLRAYLAERQPEHLNLVDVSTLADMYWEALAG